MLVKPGHLTAVPFQKKIHIWLHSTTYLALWHSTSILPYDALPCCLHSDNRRACLGCDVSRVVRVHATYAVNPGSVFVFHLSPPTDLTQQTSQSLSIIL